MIYNWQSFQLKSLEEDKFVELSGNLITTPIAAYKNIRTPVQQLNYSTLFVPK